MTETPLDEVDNKLVEEVADLLKDTDKMPLKTGVSLILAMISKILIPSTNELIGHVKQTNGQIIDIKTRVKELESKNLINWVTHNPKASITIFVLFILTVDLIVDRFPSAVVFGALWALIKKQLGL